MPWDDIAQHELNLKEALDQFNWAQAEQICGAIISRINAEKDLIPESSAKRLLQSLRRKRCFKLMTSLADAILQSGLRTPQIRRQYAQALIDQGTLGAGEMVLQSIIQDSQGDLGEELEARGLAGRIYKQLYVNRNDPHSTANQALLARALNEYYYAYELNPYQYLWHGINIVALADRARRDGLPTVGRARAVALANEILATLTYRENRLKESRRLLDAWDVATRIEANVALGLNEKNEKARKKYFKDAHADALDYIASDADAFEIASTIRQFTEVWQLDDKTPPGNYLLPILNAGYLKKQGSALERESTTIAHEAACVEDAVDGLESNFGTDKTSTLAWYKLGLETCNSVARIERRNGKGYGTGWLVKAGDFFPGEKGVLLLTNNHVISNSPNPYSIFPDECQINFQAKKQVLRVDDDAFWYSSYTELDATFLKLKGKPKAPPLNLHKRPMAMRNPAPRLYIIGHPAGRDLELSLQDNQLLAVNEEVLHYRTPTEPGSSGSPVFEPDEWKAVALHHKGNEEMKRIDGKRGTYQANEGISILALQNLTKNR
ncbi:MAG TPA: serine protease [Pyrinomonadaceae bacterium]|nr:serine protease [Pyrinomonadaceae bacterium]